MMDPARARYAAACAAFPAAEGAYWAARIALMVAQQQALDVPLLAAAARAQAAYRALVAVVDAMEAAEVALLDAYRGSYR